MSTSARSQSNHSAPPPSLAQRNFPRRVRMLLEGLLKRVTDVIEPGLEATLDESEQQLFKLAEQARSNEVQKHCFEALREIKRSRGDVVPRFLIGLEASLATLRDERSQASPTSLPNAAELSLQERSEADENTTIRELATRAEFHSSLPLFLLGQRVGVVAGRPAYDSETLPVGPHALYAILRDAIGCMNLDEQDRIVIFRQFERTVLAHSADLFESLNRYLIDQHILPTLTFVPVRANKHAAAASASDNGATRETTNKPELRPNGQAADATATPTPASASMRTTADASADVNLFDALRELLENRRSLLGKLGSKPVVRNAHTASRQDVQEVLGQLQTRPVAPTISNGKPRPRTVNQLKQDMLAQLRQITPDKQAPQLAAEDNDTIELIHMLFEGLMQDVRPNSPAAELMARLQAPLLRIALEDKSFFTQTQHPARQMLSHIAETGAQWVATDEVDRSLIEKMRMLVDRVSAEFDGDTQMLTGMVSDISSHMQVNQRKAEVAERRHIEAARGKEKLELSRLKAAETIDRLLKDKSIPKFLHSLLGQGWTDVLALTLMRHGEDSDTFRLQHHIAQRLIDSSASRQAGGESLIGPTEAASLSEDISKALEQIGYHADDAAAISARLLALSLNDAADDPATRTEIAVRLKSRPRLGERVTGDDGKGNSEDGLSDAEKAQLAILRKLPFGSWMEFTVNQQGDRVRRRLSWYSSVTGHSLFVNHRGQRVGEYSLRWLAREMVRGNVRLVEVESGNMLDRAWNRIVSSLRNFAGGKQATDTAVQEATP